MVNHPLGEGEIAWVTGASSGIGRAVALELARRGVIVAATARRERELAELARDAEGLPGRVVPFPGDVTEAAAMIAMVAAIEAAHGPIGLAFLNAGAAFPEPPGVTLGAGFARTFALNVFGTAHCLEPVIARMRTRRRGRIALNASLAGYFGIPGAPAYGASKAALIALAESLRPTLARDGIVVQVINPGFVGTPMTAVNPHPMPFLVPVDAAARRIVEGFGTSRFEITFPRRLAWPMKAVQLLPYPLFFALADRIARKG